MSKTKCNKKRTKKDRSFAEENTRKNKALRLYRQCRDFPSDFRAMDRLVEFLQPETVTQWLVRVQP